MKYIVLEASSPKKIMMMVNNKIDEGYEPLGSLVVVKDSNNMFWYAQSIIQSVKKCEIKNQPLNTDLEFFSFWLERLQAVINDEIKDRTISSYLTDIHTQLFNQVAVLKNNEH